MNNYSKDKGQLDFYCPVCGNNKFNRIQRNWLEKFIYYISLGKRKTKKYECINCKWTAILNNTKK